MPLNLFASYKVFFYFCIYFISLKFILSFCICLSNVVIVYVCWSLRLSLCLFVSLSVFDRLLFHLSWINNTHQVSFHFKTLDKIVPLTKRLQQFMFNNKVKYEISKVPLVKFQNSRHIFITYRVTMLRQLMF